MNYHTTDLQNVCLFLLLHNSSTHLVDVMALKLGQNLFDIDWSSLTLLDYTNPFGFIFHPNKSQM